MSTSKKTSTRRTSRKKKELIKRGLKSVAKKAGKKASRKAMKTAGFSIKAKDGWIVRESVDGKIKRLKKIKESSSRVSLG